jgi:Na+/H+ antiporter NhaD/arsenite permease-like protein
MVCLVPTFIIALSLRKEVLGNRFVSENKTNEKEGIIILISGVLLLLFVPALKTYSHLPPFLCMLLSLSLMWVVTTIIHFNKPIDARKKFEVSHALQKIDTPSILFFVGILLAVSALETIGALHLFASFIQGYLPDYNQLATALGLFSALIDNVPMVAAVQGMFSLEAFPKDHPFWLFLALTTGTGGSAIIIGSAAGVAAMGLEKIDFVWYLKKISWLALVGYFAGILTFILI